MGVVRQAVNISAGIFGSIGSISLAPHAASWMEFSTNPTDEMTVVF